MPLLDSGSASRHSRRAARWVVAMSVACSIIGTISIATGQPSVRVEVPAECGSKQEFLTEVAKLKSTADAESSVTEVVIAPRQEGGFALHLTSTEGLRSVVDRDCATLFRTAIVIAATMTRDRDSSPPSAAGPPAPTAAAPDAASSPSNVVVTSPAIGETDETPSAAQSALAQSPTLGTSQLAPSSDVPASRPRDSAEPAASASVPVRASEAELGRAQDPTARTRLQVGVGGAAFLGLSPNPHVGFEALAGLAHGRWAGHLALRLLPPRSMLVRDELGLRETVWGARLSASHAPVAWFRLSLGLSGYWISAEGFGISNPVSDSVGFIAPELEAAIALLTQSTVAAEIVLHGRMGLTRPRFEVDSGELVYELPRLGAAAGLRVFWSGP